MLDLLRNFWLIFRRYKVAAILNLLGLSFAFTVFYILMAEVSFEWGFDSYHRDKKCIFKVYLESELGINNVNYEAGHLIGESSPHIKAFALLNGYRAGEIIVDTDSLENHVSGLFSYVSPGFTEVFTLTMQEGSTDKLTDPDNAIIPLSLAHKVFGNKKSYLDEKIKGKGWYLNIVGVYHDLPGNSILKNAVYQILPDYMLANHMRNTGNWSNPMYIRVDKADIAAGLFDNYKWPDGYYQDDKIKLLPLNEVYYTKVPAWETDKKGNRNISYLLFSVAILIVVIGGINFMNFATSIVPLRIKDVNTRKVMGCSVAKLRFSFIKESLFISLAAFLLSLFLIELLSRTFLMEFLYADISFSSNTELLTMTFGVAIFCGILSSLYPAFYITSFKPAYVLNGAYNLSPEGRLLRYGLIGLQFVISLIVIIVVLFMNLQNGYMQHQSLGFDKDRIAMVNLTSLIKNEQLNVFVNKIKENPVVEAVAFSESSVGGTDNINGWGFTHNGERIGFNAVSVSPDYLRTMGIPVLEGRDFRDDDLSDEGGSIIFNEAARGSFSFELGEKVWGLTVAGFMPNIHYKSFRNKVKPMAFYIAKNNKRGFRNGLSIANIRFTKEANRREIASFIEGVCKELDNNSKSEVYFYDQALKDLYGREQSQTNLITSFSLLAVLISVMGVFGLIIFETQSRRKEIGIRKVYGFTTGNILYIFNLKYLRIVLISFVISVPVAWYTVYLWLQNFAYHTPIYLGIFLLAFIILSIIIVFTVTLQSWKAANENPVNSITGG